MLVKGIVGYGYVKHKNWCQIGLFSSEWLRSEEALAASRDSLATLREEGTHTSGKWGNQFSAPFSSCRYGNSPYWWIHFYVIPIRQQVRQQVGSAAVFLQSCANWANGPMSQSIGGPRRVEDWFRLVPDLLDDAGRWRNQCNEMEEIWCR